MRLKGMKKENENTRNLLFRKSIWIILIVFISSLITIPSFISKADTAKLKALEVNPGDKFELSSNADMDVTHMTMAKFISMVDELNGQYDVIIINRKNDGLNAYFDTERQYRDYTAPFSQEISMMRSNGNLTKDLNGLIGGVNQKYATKLWYTQSDVVNTKKWSMFDEKSSGYQYSDGNVESEKGNYVEYLSENDITNKRAKEVLELINSGQLVYMSNKILNDSNLADSKLHKNFKDINKDNFIKFNSISSSRIKNDYNALIKSKGNDMPNLSVVQGPKSDSDSMATGLLENRNMEFIFTAEGVSEDSNVSLYLDYNGDGLFKENEYALPDLNTKLSSLQKDGNNQYKIIHKLDPTFLGILQWKLVITKPNGVNNYVIGNAIYRSITGEKQKIRVLQIHPQTKDNKLDLYLDNDDFKTGYLTGLKDYNITVDAMPVKDLNKVTGFNNYVLGNDIVAKYDMLIIGFADGYGIGYDNEFSDKARENINKFIKSGKAVMFTHDTMSLNSFGTSGWSSKTGPQFLTKSFRDIIGQSRYIDPYNPTEIDSTNKDNKGDDTYKKIVHDSVLYNNVRKNHSDLTDNSKIKTLGITLFANVAYWESKTKTGTVEIVNKAQITSYPYDLTNGGTKTTINVAPTHTQWYQLNLEDEDVVPWYNLNNGDNFDSGDARNFYYTYSKRNITYSGTGHSNASTMPEDEYKLFVNTIVKCIRGANYKPIIENKRTDNEKSTIENESTEVIKQGNDYNFTTIPNDIDGDVMSVEINIEGLATITKKDVKSHEEISVTVPGTLTKNLSKGSKIKVTTQATDIYGQKSDLKTFYLQAGNEKPTIENKRTDNGKTIIANGTEIEVYQGSSYPFLIVPEDKDKELLSVELWVDGNKINTYTDKNSGDEIQAIISETITANKSVNDRIEVKTRAIDSNGLESDYKTFYLKILKKPYEPIDKEYF